MSKKYAFVLLIVGLISSSALACPGQSLGLINDGRQSVGLGADGLTTVIKDGDYFISTIHADANPGFAGSVRSHLDGGSSFKVKLVSQSRDPGGIMSSTYDVTESNHSVRPARERTKRYKISSNYYGNGVSAKGGCGSV